MTDPSGEGAEPEAVDGGQAAERLRQLVREALVSDSVADLDRPHVVVVTDPVAGVLLEGPYPSGWEAITAAGALEAERRREWCDSQPGGSITVWPLAAPRFT
ncbi:hypothetical protein NOCA2130004 [metagenome]|uniref:Uncharacterized protein n=1 Tax=metagenome TaxID=256318 RepID=A0A2P2BWP3_9ZZZZ